MAGLAASIALGTAGCVRVTTKQELVDVSWQAQMNTIATTIFYTGSDAAYDYFYLDKPLGRNGTCKVPRSEGAVTNRMALTRQRDSWMPFAPSLVTPLTNAIAIPDGTTTRIVVHGSGMPEQRTSEPQGVGDSPPAARPAQPTL